MVGVSANLFGDNLRLKGNAIYSMNCFDSECRPAKSNDWRADLTISYMFGDWQVKGDWASHYCVCGVEGTRVHLPAQYGFSLNWQRGNWAVGGRVENFLNRRVCTRTDANYGVYQSQSRSFSDLKGLNISVSATYTLPYGKKTDSGRPKVETKINSAILRPF